jgi:uncharacterized damage-inducible protein DinB
VTAGELRLLHAYNQWANRRVLDAAAAVPGAALRRDLGSSYRSVWDTLVHIVWAEWRWLGRWQRLPRGPGADPSECADLRALHDRWRAIAAEQRAFVDALTAPSLDEAITYENPAGVRWTYSLQLMLQHVVNHSTYHRGQVTTMLRQLGAEPASTDLLLYIDELAAGKAAPVDA